LKNRLLITGGSGFIGLNLKKLLDDSDFDICSIGRAPNEDYRIQLGSNIENEALFIEFLNNFKPQIICHLASGSNITRANENKEKEFLDTVASTKSLIGILNKLNTKPDKIIYLSSQAVYGIPQSLPVTEEHIAKPVTVYGDCKLQAEKVLSKSGINTIILRVSSVYGPKQDPNKSGVIAKFIDRLKSNNSPIVFNSFDLYSDFIYVDDLITAIISAIKFKLKQECDIYNIGSGKPIALREILDVLYKYFKDAPKPELRINQLYPDKQVRGLYLDIKKAKQFLNWQPKYKIEMGLKIMLQDMKLVNRS
jgi:UDP-glucose 4-epimerase